MEKRSPHYLLSSIQAQMTTIDAMNMTESSRVGTRLVGMKMSDALAVIRGLSRKDFFKSMTTHQDHRIWQDVYQWGMVWQAFVHQVSAVWRIRCGLVQGVMNMASKWHKKICPVCMEGVLHDGMREQEMKYKGQIYHYTAKGTFCDHCHDGISAHDPKEEAQWIKFRDQIDEQELAELARIRKKLKLTQQQAAAIAGGGKNAFSRYERGQSKPVYAVINLFRLLDKHPELLDELRITN